MATSTNGRRGAVSAARQSAGSAGGRGVVAATSAASTVSAAGVRTSYRGRMRTRFAAVHDCFAELLAEGRE
ncbi:hypothetical protein AB0G13_34515, partial [Micromonospora sp. NPDC023633]